MAVADEMRGKEDHIRIMKNQRNALKKTKNKAEKEQDLHGNLSTSVNKKEMLKNMPLAYHEKLNVDFHVLEKTPPHKRNLNLLRNAKDLQCTLQKDDLWWD